MSLVTKVYFPRLAAPVASVLPGLVDLGIALVILAVFMAVSGTAPTLAVVTLPLWLLATGVLALGVGLSFATLNVRYRDVKNAIGLFVQLWLFATPVAYLRSRPRGVALRVLPEPDGGRRRRLPVVPLRSPGARGPHRRVVRLGAGRGWFPGIVGRNGAGKSTLPKVLTRITEPTEGVSRTRGRVGALLEVGTGFHPELTGRENVYLNGAINGMGRRDIDACFDEIADFSGVERFLDTPIKRYSSGMYLRWAFAVAAHMEPDILVVDEVLTVGDAEFQRKCLGRMETAEQEGRTVIFVSHSLDSVLRLCPRTVWLDGGRIEGDRVPPADARAGGAGHHTPDLTGGDLRRAAPPPVPDGRTGAGSPLVGRHSALFCDMRRVRVIQACGRSTSSQGAQPKEQSIMKKKILGLAAATALTGGLMFTSAVAPAGAAHYCKDTPAGLKQTNGNGNRGGSDGWKNSSAGAERSPALFDCPVPPPAPNN